MTLHVHHLTGCAPVPLAHYLKAIGVLRLIAEQADPDARGWWQDEHFCLLTRLDRSSVMQFFLENYAPSPIFNPWGARSGYYRGGSESSARSALVQIENSTEPRLEPFRRAICTIREVIGDRDKPDSEAEAEVMLSQLRARLRGNGIRWLDSVKVRIGNRYRSPALFGTGGNEGSGSYSSGFLSAIVECIIRRARDNELRLFDVASTPAGRTAWKGTFGQFIPAGEGSAWDYLLAIEGGIVFRSSVTRTAGGTARFLSSPFYFAPRAGGAGSSSVFDEFVVNKGRTSPGRGEQWFPIWRMPVRAAELEMVIAAGRCSHGRNASTRSLDAARAIGQFGVARGFEAFTRFGYLQRNNLAGHFAVPLSRIVVRDRPRTRLFDDVAGWMDRIHRIARGKGTSSRFVDAERLLANAAYAAIAHDDDPLRWQALLVSLQAIEQLQTTGSAVRAGPLPPLMPEWLSATCDYTPEWRLAVALASAAATYRHGSPIDPIRHHWLPLRPGARRFREEDERLVRDPRVVMNGREPVADCIAVVERRLTEASQRGTRRLPLVSAPGCGARPSDLALCTAGDIDLGRTLALARALMPVRWDRVHETLPVAAPVDHSWPDEPWMAIRLAHLAWPLSSDREIPADDAIVRRLAAGDVVTASEFAVRRLRACGLRPPFRAAVADKETARRWAAALAFPIDHATARAMARRFDPNYQENQ